MKELDPLIFIAVFQEMLGWLYWPLVAFTVLGLLAFAAVIVRDRGIVARRFVLAELAGIAGGFIGVWFMLAITNSQLSDIGGPIDWLLVAAIWLAGAVVGTAVAYLALAALGNARPAAAERPVPLVERKAGI